MHADHARLAEALGYQFREPERLQRALSHRSIEQPGQDNERMEFLGDAVLGFLVSEWLVENCTELSEGDLSKRKAYLVSANHLFEIAQRLSLGDFLVMSRGLEKTGGRRQRALLSDALEAVIAALYLDGGIEQARRFVHREILREGSALPYVDLRPLADYKTPLQERAQALKLPNPDYTIVKQSGPVHARLFTVEVRIGPNLRAQAEGASKKSAGQEAARLLLAQLKELPKETA